MSVTLEEKFKQRWPEFFVDVRCGFYLPDKWESLLWALCENLERTIENAREEKSTLKVAQVKDKFFGLRFYYNYSGSVGESIDSAVRLAEDLSYAPEYALGRE